MTYLELNSCRQINVSQMFRSQKTYTSMKASPCWLSCGRPSGLPFILASITLSLCGSLIAASLGASTAYRRGLKAENTLDLFGARNHFQEVLAHPDSIPGSREHVAWFLYRNGFHDRQCLSLLEQVKTQTAHPAATARSIRDLRCELGLAPPEPTRTTTPPPPPSRGSSKPDRLQYARELYWSGALPEAKTAYAKLVEEMPNKPALRWEYSKVLASSEQYQQAVDQLEVAGQLLPGEPEIILAQAEAEAKLGHRSKAVGMLKGLKMDDPARIHLIRGIAHHRVGEFAPAAVEYRKVLTSRPYHEEAAFGLAECSLRINAIPEARGILKTWADTPRNIDWSERNKLEYFLTAPRLRVGSSYLENSLDYEVWSIGADLRLRPTAALDISLAVTHDRFDQSGFRDVSRETAVMSASYQANDIIALQGQIGVNDYDNGWTTLNGSCGIMLRPTPNLEFRLDAAVHDVVDSEPPMGISLYDLASTIGAVAGRASMESLSASVTWQTPIENVQAFGKYRIATLEGDNTLDDAYGEITWMLSRDPMLRLGYGVAYMNTEDPSPIYTEGTLTTPLYYDPDSLVVHNIFLEASKHCSNGLSYGSELHLYLQPDNDTTGVGIFGFIRYTYNEQHSMQLDARYYTQDRGRNRNQTDSGHYDAFNLVACYEYRF